MTNPITSSLAAVKSQAMPAGPALYEVVARRADDISRKLRRAEEIKAMATDKTSTNEARGLSKTAIDLSRGASLLQIADQGLDAVASSLRRIQVLIDKAADPATSIEERARLHVELDTTRQDVARVVQQTQANGLRSLDDDLGSTVTVNVWSKLVMAEMSATRTSLATSAAGAAQTAATTFDYPPPTVPGVVANNVQITTGAAVAQTVTVRGTMFELGTFAPDAKALAAAINAIQGESGVLEAHADPNVLVGVSTEHRSGREGTDPSATVAINGTVFTVFANARATAEERRAAAIGATNAVSSRTGVVATDNGRGVTLTADDGRNITVLFDDGAGAVAASAFGMPVTGVEGKASTIDFRYTRRGGFASGTVEFSGTTGVDARYRTLTVAAPTVAGATATTTSIAKPSATATAVTSPNATPVGTALQRTSEGPGIDGIDLNDVASLDVARQLVDSTLELVVGARSRLEEIGERVMSALEGEVEVSVGNASLRKLRYDSAARAVEGAQRLRDLMTRDWGMGFAAQANSSGSDALRAMSDL